MGLKELIDKVNSDDVDSFNWQQIREEIINKHEHASTTDERVALLSLHKDLMGGVERQLSDSVEIERFRKARSKEYNSLIIRECLIGGSICTETLYELTQREIEAGRMEPTHRFIDIAVEAMAEPHYSRERLLKQEAKIQAQQSKPTLREKLLRAFSK